MPWNRSVTPNTCLRGLYRQFRVSHLSARSYHVLRAFSSSSASPQHAGQPAAAPTGQASKETINDAATNTEHGGAMSRRLAEMTDETIEQGGRHAQKAIQESGFSEEMKKRLEARILDSRFKIENPVAFAQMSMPSSAGRGSQSIATAQPWAGNESLEDTSLRMLNDAHKPLRGTGPPKIPAPRGLPTSVDMRMKKAVQNSQGQRLANARDRTSVYALSRDSNLTEEEKEQMRKQLKERFTSGARPMPASIQGLAALANERIEDAIARGQFKNIPRGKGTNIERDYMASSPFLDTTEYFMNKIIQKQEIVPPWIEKQQELIKAAQIFRSRLRADWKRHAARVIASKGGSLEAQVKRAEAYVTAEAANNPKAPEFESLSEIDNEGKISQVTVTETPTPSSPTEDAKITVSEDLASSSPPVDLVHPTPPSPSPKTPMPTTLPPPFRDPAWQSLEHAYHTLAISSLNSLARSYNLLAPDLAKKPYFSLPRELSSCFADIAPQLPDEIRERARAPARVKVEVIGHREGGVLERFGGRKAKVWDSKRPNYGFKEFWRDLWCKD